MRDFEWSETCRAVSGGCNAYARSPSYFKGDFVPPEDLSAVAEAGSGSADEAEEDWEWDAQGLQDDIREFELMQDMLHRRTSAPPASLAKSILSSLGWTNAGEDAGWSASWAGVRGQRRETHQRRENPSRLHEIALLLDSSDPSVKPATIAPDLFTGPA
jgi:hypothetical protein